MDRSRRRLLRGLGSLGLAPALAGCTAPGAGGTEVTLLSVDPAPDLPVRPDVVVVRAAATPEHPPRLRTSLANTGDERVTVGEGRAVHFEHVVDDDGALVLLPAGPDREYPAEPGCFRLTEPVPVTREYRTFPIEPESTSLRHVDLYATPDGEGCLPTGESRFETTISVLEDGERSMSAKWGVSLVLA